MVKFLISGNGFLDPYSTYFQFKVKIPDIQQNEVRFLDRSAHSFFQRIVIRSQGVELERIDHYDIIAAMINDMIYSPEQCTHHYWEGFPTHIYTPQLTDIYSGLTYEAPSIDTRTIGGGVGNVFKKWGYRSECSRSELRDCIAKWLCQGSSPSTYTYIGETAFHDLLPQDNHVDLKRLLVTELGEGHTEGDYKFFQEIKYPLDYPVLPDFTYYAELVPLEGSRYPGKDAPTDPRALTNVWEIGDPRSILYPVSFAYHQGGIRIPSIQIPAGGLDNGEFKVRGTLEMTFIVPIYSGVIGLLMPEKKLLPLNLLPLDIEVVFNPHALYSSQLQTGRRNYVITEFFMYGNTMFFEQEIHRTLEASVADHGLFIYCNSFHSAPQQLISSNALPSTMFISMNLKSINSVHWIFMYNYFETKACARKLHFVSHNINKLQLLNGTQLIPQYPIEGNAGTSRDGSQMPFTIELLKAWNKMHDPKTDGALHAYNTCGDQYCGQFDPIYGHQSGPFLLKKANPPDPDNRSINWNFNTAPGEAFQLNDELALAQTAMQIINKQANVGRCQYGISLEGEELGSERTMITGRKSQYPFQLQMSSTQKFSAHTSYMFTFLRADFIVYIRPDLQIVTLGK